MAESDNDTTAVQSVTSFTKPNGDAIEIRHSQPLLNVLGADLLSAIRYWHSGRVVRRGNE